MNYIFIVNGRPDKDFILPDLKRQIKENNLSENNIFVTSGPGEGTRYVNLYCDLHPKEEVCFISCGGSGTANEVVSGVVGRDNKYVAFLAYGGTNDYTKCYPDLDFHSLKGILGGHLKKIDAIKANESYSFNVINIGFDSNIANYWAIFQEERLKNPFNKAMVLAILRNRFNSIRVVADGEVLCEKRLTLITVGNAKWCAGKYLSCPKAVDDDGLMDVVIFKTMSLLRLIFTIGKYAKGIHLDDKSCRSVLIYRKVKHLELSSTRKILLGMDGEIIAGSHFKLDVLEKSINLILPE